MTSLISLTEARQQILDALCPLPAEKVALASALGRVLAEGIVSDHDQPAADMSAMDGYAVRRSDCVPGEAVAVVGEARAGAPYADKLRPGQAVRISTGAYVPQGADHILIQEEARIAGDGISLTPIEAQSANGFIRVRGRDFASGDILLPARTRLNPAAIALAAAAGRGHISVYRRPSIAILTNGDELCEPGEPLRAGALYDSNGPALAAQMMQWGADIGWQGRGGDNREAMASMMASARAHDLLVVAGGASVGPHDIVRDVFTDQGGALIFSRIALKPGKPAWAGQLGRTLVIGLPGNPASAFVTAELLVRLAVEAMTGQTVRADLPLRSAQLSQPLRANGPRETFLRAGLRVGAAGRQIITPLLDQDSSLLRPLVAADALLHRRPGAAALAQGDIAFYWPLTGLANSS